MNISNHWLVPDDTSEQLKISPSNNVGGLIDPDYLIIHYTATDSAESAVDWFMNTHSNPNRIAAHIVIDTDGTITQLVPFNRKANHAGTSTWEGVDFLNSHSIGIEIVNPGFVELLNDGTYRRVIAEDKNGNLIFKSYPASDKTRIIEALHKHKFWNAKDNKHWFKYPSVQLNALYNLCKLLFEKYQFVTALGHDDISPARKPDPGPAFPWEEFNKNVFGWTNNNGKLFKVNTNNTNFRAMHSTTSVVLKKLPINYEVGLIETAGQWSKVYLADKQQDVLIKDAGVYRSIKTIGWIFSQLLTQK